jgi:hypothetical protein
MTVCACAAGAAGRSSAEGVGCLFLAHRGAGAYVAPLSSQAPAGPKLSSSSAGLQRIHVQDATDMQQARFMESYESRHSDHSFTAAVVRSRDGVRVGLYGRGAGTKSVSWLPGTCIAPAFHSREFGCMTQCACGRLYGGGSIRSCLQQGWTESRCWLCFHYAHACDVCVYALLQAQQAGVTLPPLRMDSQVKYGEQPLLHGDFMTW